MNNPVFRAISLLAMSLALGACALNPGKPVPAPVADTEQPVAEKPSRPFPKDTLYDLILAEMAGKRTRADITLTRYAKQAKETMDPNVLARATEISALINAQPLTLELGQMWVQAEPDSLNAHYIVVLNSLRNQRFDETIPALDGLLKLNPDADLEQIFLSGLPPTREARSKLLSALDTMPPQYADSPQVSFARALVQEQNGDRSSALANVRQAQKAHPKNVPDILLEARILMEGGDGKAAENRIAKALADQPDSRALRQNYARVLVHNGNFAAAETQYKQLIVGRPDDGDTILTLALLAIERDDEEVARQNLERLVALDQHADEAHYYLGGIARRHKDIDTALAELEEVGPGNVFLNARQDMADLLLQENELVAAREKLAAARSLSPDVATQLYAMEADILVRGKQPQEALDLLNGAIRFTPDSDLLVYSRAMTAEKLGKMDLFESDMRNLLQHDPNNATALNALGYTLAERTDRLSEAQGYISKALTLRPNDPAIIDSMGWLKFRQGDNKTALGYLQKAYQLLPDDEIAAHVGEVLWSLGRKDEARKVWNEALTRVPGSEFITAVQTRLDKNGKH
jgi:predicted Zn-dependent protease